MVMEPQLQLEEALHRPMVETVDEEEQEEEQEQEEVGLKRKKHVGPTKNDLHPLDSTVSAQHYHAKIITSSSNISSITTNDEDSDELLLVNNGSGHAIGDEVHLLPEEDEEEEEATAIFEENWGEQQKRQFLGEDESGIVSTIEQHTVEYSNGFDVFVSETATNLVRKEYDLTAKESDTVNSNAQLLVSDKDQMDGEGEFNIPSEKIETQQVPSQHHHHHHHYHHHQEGHTEFVDQVDVKEGVESEVIEEIEFEEIDVEETDYNVEEVVEKQNTHDLICPNCSSCITRTVILRRRPKLRKHIRRTRKPKPKVTHPTEVITPVAPVAVAPAPVAATDPDIDIGDTEAFRCQACFSFFIRIGASIFSRTKTEEVRTSPEITASGTTSTVTSQVVLDQKQVEEDIGTSSQAMVNGATNTSSVVTTEYAAVTSVTEVTSSTSVTVTVGQTQRETWTDHSKEEVTEAAAEPANLVTNSLLPVNGIDAGEINMDLGKLESEYINGDGTENRARWQTLTQRQKLLYAFQPSKQTEVNEKKKDNTVEKEPVVVVAPSQGSVLQETPADLVIDEERQQPHLVRQTSNDFDILKSVVYGGLMESITSLGVVSSAVGAGASTLNIFVLALANLIGGLFVLAHNLKELRKETDETTTQADTEEESKRYFKLLGRRGRFPIHATVAVISYIIFGVVAPITYGFSFHVSNDRDYKLASVAAASLFGVFLLALAKAHVRSPPSSYGSYIKTVLEYLTLGAAASGISFLAGELLDKIMQQLGWLDSTSSSVAAPLMQMQMQSGPGWASY